MPRERQRSVISAGRRTLAHATVTTREHNEDGTGHRGHEVSNQGSVALRIDGEGYVEVTGYDKAFRAP
jgi:hypothetical protein